MSNPRFWPAENNDKQVNTAEYTEKCPTQWSDNKEKKKRLILLQNCMSKNGKSSQECTSSAG